MIKIRKQKERIKKKKKRTAKMLKRALLQIKMIKVLRKVNKSIINLATNKIDQKKL